MVENTMYHKEFYVVVRDLKELPRVLLAIAMVMRAFLSADVMLLTPLSQHQFVQASGLLDLFCLCSVYIISLKPMLRMDHIRFIKEALHIN